VFSKALVFKSRFIIELYYEFYTNLNGLKQSKIWEDKVRVIVRALFQVTTLVLDQPIVQPLYICNSESFNGIPEFELYDLLLTKARSYHNQIVPQRQ